MIWNCPECRRSNSSDIAPTDEREVSRFCAFCGSRAVLVPESGTVRAGKSGDTAQVSVPRPTARMGPGKPVLVLLHGRKVGAELPLPIGRVKIGAGDADWDFPDEGLARVHFQIDFLMGKCYIRDLTNGEQGISVNARTVSYAELRNGDQIRAGKATFLFLMIYRDEKAESTGSPFDETIEPSGDPNVETSKSKLDDVRKAAGGGGEGIWDSLPAQPEEVSSPATVIVPKKRLSEAAPTPTKEVSLRIESGPDAGKEIPLLFASNVIGRGLCEIPLADPLCSQRHAEIGRLAHGGFFLKDLASSNGTLLNGQLVHYSPLDDGDSIQIGESVLRFVVA